MARWLPVCLVLLLVLAGCSGPLDPLDDDEPQSTVTPAAVPTDQPMLAPGLTGEGVVNATALATAHARVLRNTSYTSRHQQVIRGANGTVQLHYEVVTTVSADRARVRERMRVKEGSFSTPGDVDPSLPRRATLWLGPQQTLRRVTYLNGTTAVKQLAPEQAEFRRRSYNTSANQVRDILGGATTTVTERATRNGTRMYQVTATDWPHGEYPFIFSGEGTVQNATLSLMTTEEGLVRRYRGQYTLDQPDGGTRLITIERRYWDVGNTTINRPDWVTAHAR